MVCENCSTDEGGDNLSINYIYSAPVPFQSEDVTSDFGARYLGYDWHKGVDYRPLQYAGNGDDAGRGTAILSASSGKVHRINAVSGYKYIAIDGFGENDFGYGHIFNARNPESSRILTLRKIRDAHVTL